MRLLGYFIALLCLSSVILSSKCNDTAAPIDAEVSYDPIVEDANTILTRFIAPESFVRKVAPDSSFAHYIRHLKLKPANSPVLTYIGNQKYNQDVHAAVFNLPIGDKDLHQCADAVMRLRADYFYHKGEYDKIGFKFTNGHYVAYSKWRAGNRIAIEGNNTKWVASDKESTSDQAYWEYLEQIFMYAGTASLSKELHSKPIDKLAIGDVFIKGGHPGHAVIVIDKAIDGNGNTVFMLAQSYMPAQELHVLKNLNDSRFSPWYILDDVIENGRLESPEWTFELSELKEF